MNSQQSTPEDGADEILRLRVLVESLAERLAAQSELLAEKAQRPRAPSS